MSSQRLTCQEENKLIISRALDNQFECQTNLTMESWETFGRGKIKNIKQQLIEVMDKDFLQSCFVE